MDGFSMKTKERIQKRARELFRKHQGETVTSWGRTFRTRGMTMQSALCNARAMDEWEHLESVGLVRFRWIADEDVTMEDLEGDTFNPDANPDIRPEQIAKEREEFHRLVERDGVWCLIGEFRMLPLHHGEGDIVPYYPEDQEPGWETGDSVWGLVGIDDNGYESSIAYATIEALKTTLRSRCPKCRKIA